MKRALRFVLFILFICGSYFDLHAQLAGQLYSLIYGGGRPPTDKYGNLNMFDPINRKDSSIFDFTGLNGIHPYGNLVQTNGGMLWGMAPYGGKYGSNATGGVIFRYNILTGLDTVVYNFNPSDTSLPSTSYGSLLLATDSNFYGLSYVGGYAGSGTIFKFNPRTLVCTKLNSMWGRTTGFLPTSSFIQVNDSMLYATAQYWKGYLPGSILWYNIKSGVADTAHVFRAPTDGAIPRGGLIKATNGLLYGLTINGGTNNQGVIYSYNTSTKVEKVEYNFDRVHGAFPQGCLFQAKDGYLYGTTDRGGAHDSGTLFKYDIVGKTLTTVISFTGPLGISPYADVIQAGDGKLYGMCDSGGVYNLGTVFSYDPTLNIAKNLYSFNDTNGAWPYGNFLEVMNARDSVANNKCPGDSAGSITIIVRGGAGPFTYHWSNGATTSSITGLKYSIDTGTVIDSRGIAFTFIDTVGPAPMNVTFNVSNACYGGGAGTASANVSGGLAPFSYTWSNGNTSDTATNLSSGTYTCTIKDANGCPGSGVVTIAQAAQLKIDTIIAKVQSCYYCHDGTLTAVVSGGVPPGDTVCYHYLWSNVGNYTGSDSNTISGLDSGTYYLCVTSCYGCGSVCDSSIVYTGIKNITNAANSINVYPNPNNGKFTISFSHQADIAGAKAIVEIYDIMGQKVNVGTLKQVQGDVCIDMSGQPNGVYILRVNTQQSVLTQRIIIQR